MSETGAPAIAAGHTRDAFHRGRFHLVQPKGGHRAGMDAMVLAAAVPSPFSGALADLGAGAGAAGLAVAARCPAATVTLVENAPEMAECARLSLALPDNAALKARTRVLEADVTLSGSARRGAGLGDGAFDFAILNPPFNAPGDRASPDALRRSAHVAGAGAWEAWLRTAAAIVRPGGGVALIARPASLGEVLAALGRRFGGARIRAIHPRAGAEAIRIVLRAVRGSRAGLSLAAPLVLHAEGGHAFGSEADAINNGRTSLFGD